jgi:hypothetical protein
VGHNERLDLGQLQTRKFLLLHVSVNMERWSNVQRAFTVKSFYKNSDSFVSAQRAFRCEFNLPPRAPVPSCKAIALRVKSTASTARKKGRCEKQSVHRRISIVDATLLLQSILWVHIPTSLWKCHTSAQT